MFVDAQASVAREALFEGGHVDVCALFFKSRGVCFALNAFGSKWVGEPCVVEQLSSLCDFAGRFQRVCLLDHGDVATRVVWVEGVDLLQFGCREGVVFCFKEDVCALDTCAVCHRAVDHADDFGERVDGGLVLFECRVRLGHEPVFVVVDGGSFVELGEVLECLFGVVVLEVDAGKE